MTSWKTVEVLCTACLLLAFSISSVAGHKETPAQKQFINRFAKYLEREGWQATWIGVKGKAGDVFAIDLPRATVEAVYRFKKQCIDGGTTREELKAAGFHSVLIYTGVQSATFPKGEAMIPLD
jgi:hypothetical protein